LTLFPYTTLFRSANTDEYPLSVESLNYLFPPEFSMNLRLNLNRPFGNGVDDSAMPFKGRDGQIDEPVELLYSNEKEYTYDPTNNSFPASNVSGYYRRGINERNSSDGSCEFSIWSR
jgi:hypothetical protein